MGRLGPDRHAMFRWRERPEVRRGDGPALVEVQVYPRLLPESCARRRQRLHVAEHAARHGCVRTRH